MALPPGPWLPSPVQTAWWMTRPMDLFRRCVRRYGDVFTLRLAGIGKMVVVCSPDGIKQVFTADAGVLHAGEANYILRPFVGPQSVLVLDGARHLRQRRLLLPPFHGERMQAYLEEMCAAAEASLDQWPLGQPFALHPRMQAITLQVILRTVFGVREASEVAELSDLLRRLLEATTNASPLRMLPAFLRIDLFKLLPWSHASRLMQETNRAIYAEIARRRARPRPGDDILSMLLDARDEDGQPMSDDELRDELVTLLVAGHETTATALSWTFERILTDRAVFGRLHAELVAAAGPGPLAAATLERLPYLDAVIRESLRLRPIIALVARRTKAPFTVGGFALPAGVVVAPNIAMTQLRPEIYPDPERFLPERFLGKKPDPYAWLPFGGGIRRCIGMAFALYEMKAVTATILARASLRLAPGPAVTAVRRGITFAPSGGTTVILDARGARTRAAGRSRGTALADARK